MKTIILLICFSLFVSTAFSKPSIKVGSTLFYEAFSEQNEQGTIKEYLPKDESLDSWTSLVAVRKFTNIRSPKKYIDNLAKEYRNALPHMQFAVMQKPDSDDWMIDYIMYPRGEDTGFVEWNFFQAKKSDSGKGITVNQFVTRKPYSGSLEEVFSNWDLKAYRNEMLSILLPHQFKEE